MHSRKSKNIDSSTSSQPIEINQKTNSRNLISLIDDIDLSMSQEEKLESYGKNVVKNETGSSKVFEFSSHPHSLPRDNTPIHMNSGDTALSSSFHSSREQERERIQQKILRTTPTPRAAANSPNSHGNSHDLKMTKSINPPSSLSPDLSSSHSSRVYDSSKYSDEGVSHSQVIPPTNKSLLSLQSSDATLTESIDTLVQSSLNAESSKDQTFNNSSLNSSNQVRIRYFYCKIYFLLF